MRTTSFCNRSTIGFGVPAGATSPFKSSDSWPGKPDSVVVGTSGKSGERLALVTASARSLPSLIRAAAGGSAMKAIGVWLPSVELISGAAPWNGTRTMSAFRPSLKSRSVVNCPKPMLMLA